MIRKDERDRISAQQRDRWEEQAISISQELIEMAIKWERIISSSSRLLSELRRVLKEVELIIKHSGEDASMPPELKKAHDQLANADVSIKTQMEEILKDTEKMGTLIAKLSIFVDEATVKAAYEIPNGVQAFLAANLNDSGNLKTVFIEAQKNRVKFQRALRGYLKV